MAALAELLEQKSFAQATVDEIATRAGLHRGAFLKRFGSKKNALLCLYAGYTEKASALIASIRSQLPHIASISEVCRLMSQELERIQTEDFAANRAMHEMFLEELRTDPQTKRIFMETVDLMRAIQTHFLPAQSFTDNGAYSATQLLVTINYNYVLKAMPALPKDPGIRHALIADCLVRSLQI